MPNIGILAKVAPQLFCSKGCSYTKRLCLKTERNSNIRIISKAVLQIFCSQGCSYTKCLCPKKGSNSTENLRNKFKIQSVHLHLGLYLYAKYQDPSQSGSSDILFTRLFLTKCLCPKNGNNSNENLRNRFKS